MRKVESGDVLIETRVVLLATAPAFTSGIHVDEGFIAKYNDPVYSPYWDHGMLVLDSGHVIHQTDHEYSDPTRPHNACISSLRPYRLTTETFGEGEESETRQVVYQRHIFSPTGCMRELIPMALEVFKRLVLVRSKYNAPLLDACEKKAEAYEHAQKDPDIEMLAAATRKGVYVKMLMRGAECLAKGLPLPGNYTCSSAIIYAFNIAAVLRVNGITKLLQQWPSNRDTNLFAQKKLTGSSLTMPLSLPLPFSSTIAIGGLATALMQHRQFAHKGPLSEKKMPKQPPFSKQRYKAMQRNTTDMARAVMLALKDVKMAAQYQEASMTRSHDYTGNENIDTLVLKLFSCIKMISKEPSAIRLYNIMLGLARANPTVKILDKLSEAQRYCELSLDEHARTKKLVAVRRARELFSKQQLGGSRGVSRDMTATRQPLGPIQARLT